MKVTYCHTLLHILKGVKQEAVIAQWRIGVPSILSDHEDWSSEYRQSTNRS